MVPSTPPFKRSPTPAERSTEFAAHQRRLKAEAAARRRKAADSPSQPARDAERPPPPAGR
jgi:hypothetical protein